MPPVLAQAERNQRGGINLYYPHMRRGVIAALAS